jgi:Lipocalin-like domain
MNSLLSTGAAILLLSFGSVSGQAQSGITDRDHFVGAWRLIELDQPGSDGKLNKIECSGLFVFTRDGHLSVQVMDRESKPQSSSAGPEQYSQGGYEASYGSYVVDEQARTFTFHVEGALVRTLIGKDLPRSYELSGNRLIVRSTRPDEHWRVIWEHY